MKIPTIYENKKIPTILKYKNEFTNYENTKYENIKFENTKYRINNNIKIKIQIQSLIYWSKNTGKKQINIKLTSSYGSLPSLVFFENGENG